jgi:hypothetical protein
MGDVPTTEADNNQATLSSIKVEALRTKFG